MDSSSSTPTSFWKRPEGKAGYLVLAALAVPATIIGVKVLPWVITAVENMYILGGLLVGAFVVVKLLTSNAAWYLFQTVSRAMAGLVIDLDPVSIMQSFLAFAVSQRAKLVDAIAEVQGAKRNLDQQVTGNARTIKQYQAQAQAGMSAGATDENLEVNAALENAAAIKRASDELAEMSKDLDSGIADLLEALKRVDYEISTTKNQVDLEKQRYKAAQALGSATSKIASVLSGSAKRDMYDMATDRIRTQYGDKRAKLEILVETSRTAAGSIDLTKRALRNEGLADLRKQISGLGSQGLLGAGVSAPVVSASKAGDVVYDFLSTK